MPPVRAGPAPFDAVTLKTIPLMDVIRLATIRYDIIVDVDDRQKVDILKEVDGLDPKVRTLIWLAVMESALTDSIPSNDFAPIRYITRGYFLTRTAAALRDAGMARRAALFVAAMASIKERTVDPDRKPPRNVADFEVGTFVPLGDGFGSKGDFDDAILTYVGATPAAAAWCATERAKLPDKDRLEGLLTGLGRIKGSRQMSTLATWPEPYRVIRLVEIYNDEVGNGGVHQYFFNSSGDLAPATVDGLRTIGLPKQAATVAKGMGFFAKPYPTDRAIRGRAFDHEGTTDWDSRLDGLTGEADDGTLEPAMIAYAKRKGVLPR